MIEKEKGIKYILMIGSILSFLLCILFVFNVKSIKRINPLEYKKINIDNNYIYEINITEENNAFLISGYIYDQRLDILTSSIRIGMYNEDYYCLPTKLIYKENFSKKKNKNGNNGWCGFEAKLNVKELRESVDEYKIFFYTNFNDNEQLIMTNKYLKDLIKNDGQN